MMNLPKDFEIYTRQLFGDELYATFRHALDEEAPVSVRVKSLPLAPSEGGGKSSPQSLPIVPWCPTGYYLSSRPPFTFDPLLHAGAYYVQEASSMFIDYVARQLFHEPLLMLDLCAAPGGKTTALRSALPEGSLLFSNEPIKTRASILKENVEKWGNPDCVVTNNYPRDYAKSKLIFDAILADVPCSGEGMFRKDPDSINEWSLQNVAKCSELQRSIIKDIWSCLRPGGILIYSTCTYNAHEDEENVKWIMEELGAGSISLPLESLPLAPSEGGGKSGPMPSPWGRGYRFIPGVTKGEGLYMAVLKKKGESKSVFEASLLDKIKVGKAQVDNKKKDKSKNNQIASIASIDNWVNGDFAFFTEKDFIRAIPARWVDIYNNVKSKLHVIHAGVGIGTLKGKNIIPDASLALSDALNKDAFPQAELSYDDAIKYLRREAITLNSSVPKGLVVVTFKGYPLGFVKNLGNRANNLYPQEWRIKSTHQPSESFTLL